MAAEPYNPSPIGNPSVLARRNWLQTKLVIFIGKHMMRIKKRIHFLICCWCQRYEEQLRYIRRTASRFPEHADKASDASLPPKAKERIKAKIGEQAQ